MRCIQGEYTRNPQGVMRAVGDRRQYSSLSLDIPFDLPQSNPVLTSRGSTVDSDYTSTFFFMNFAQTCLMISD